jgi:shikimate dehydrogenase
MVDPQNRGLRTAEPLAARARGTGRSKNRVGLRQVAAKAGVSTATVSRAMNNPETVSPELRRRIDSVVRDLGRIPDGAARTLATRRSGAIGAVFPTPERQSMSASLGGVISATSISGATTLLGIVGDPIAQVRSPAIYNPKVAHAGANAVLVPMRVTTDDFEPAMRGLMRIRNLAGLVITYPHKERALALADRVLEVGRQVGAINALRRESDGSWTGEMFDGVGLVRALQSFGQRLDGRRVMLLGAGGAGSAIAVSLAAAGAAVLTIFDIKAGRAANLAARVAAAMPGCLARAGEATVAGKDLLINATPVGMAPGDGLPVPIERLPATVTVVDIIPQPTVTPLLAYAARCGCPHVGGSAMVDGQSDAVLEFFGIVAART